METEIEQTTTEQAEEQEPIFPGDLAHLRASGLAARVHPSHLTVDVARSSLACYYALLDEATEKLRGGFTEAECGYMVEVGMGCLNASPTYVQVFPIALEEAIPDYEAKWQINGLGLVNKVRRLDRLSLTALVDAISRWRVRQDREDSLAVSELFSSAASEKGAARA